MTRRFALTRGRLAAALDYYESYALPPRREGAAELLPVNADATDAVAGVLTRLYGRAKTISRGEVAYWTIEDEGRALRREEGT